MLPYYLITTAAQFIEAFAGFGSTALALPFLALFIPTSQAVVLLSLNVFLVNSFILFTGDIKKVNWKEYRRLVFSILPLLPLGLFVFSRLQFNEGLMRLLLGLVIVFAGGRNCYYAFVKKTAPRPLSVPARYAALISGAVVHGIFGTGGPLLTLYVADRIPGKDEFRATMNAMWVTLNMALIFMRAVFLKLYTPELIKLSLSALPLVALGVAAGMLLHKKVDNARFQKAVYIILFAGGLVSVLYSVYGMLA